MALGGRKSRGRREPKFDAAPKPKRTLRADPRDRAGESGARAARRGAAGTGGRTRSKHGKAARRSLFGRIVYWGLVAGLWALIAAIGAFVWIAAHLPPIQTLEIPKRPPSIQIVGTDGHVLATRGEMGGAAVALKDIPAYLPQAFVAIEDRRFFEHHGIDPIGVGRAFIANVLHRGVSQGGSTLTQQLAKNLFLTQERTLSRKVQEVVLALWLEHKFSKNQILELYLNRVYFGAGAYGVEAAARRYFDKPARAVTLAEAALLAGLVKSPSRLAPTRNPEGAARRAEMVIAAMQDAGYITAATAKAALAHPARVVKSDGAGSIGYVADWVMDVADDLLGHIDQDVVVETSIDPALQAAAESALVQDLAAKSAKYNVGQGALVAMTPDGAVRALVGGRNYGESQFNRAIAARRQPGSAFKPFVYLTALERGLTPEAVREDRPIAVKGWRPENYGHEYLGPVTLTRALAMSLNTVAVRLTLEVGPKAVIRTAHRLGIASKLEPNASIALGTSEVSPLELVAAYAPFANGGLAVTPSVIERIRTPAGRILYRRDPRSLGRVVDPRYVAMMNTMMRETLVSGTAHKADLGGWPAAGKTGTSQEFRDAWFVGYTARLIAGVWLGNDDSSPTRRVTGGGLPVEIWSRFMRAAHRNVPVAELPGMRAPVFPTTARYAAPEPAAAQPAPAPGRGDAETVSLDRWLLDRLFGRR